MKNNIINFYITGREFLDGLGQEGKIKIDTLAREFNKEVQEAEVKSEEKNYGRGADWVVILVEFIAQNPYIGAVAKIGGLITLCKHLVEFFNNKKEKGLLLGLQSGRYYSIFEVSKQINIDSIEILYEVEINKAPNGFDSKEYIYLFGINKTQYDLQEDFNKETFYRGSVYLVHIDWTGKVLDIRAY